MPAVEPDSAEPQVPANDDRAPEIELTVLMPCLNEAETLATCINKAQHFFERSGISGEVLIADNGSTDGSQTLAERHGARVIAIAERGYGAALRGGFTAARGKYVIMGDSDDSYDFSRLENFVEALRDGGDLVMGNRFKGGIADHAMPPLHRWFGNPALSFIGRVIFDTRIGDFNCGLRGFKRDAFLGLDLTAPGMEFASEMVIKAAIHKLDVREVPTTLSKDGRSRPPHIRTWRDGWRNLRFMLLHSPRWLFAIPGLMALCFGMIGIAVLFSGPLEIGAVELDLHTLMAACFAVMVGVQLLTFAIVTRRFAARSGLLPPNSWIDRLFGTMTLERFLQLSLGLVVIGVFGSFSALWTWIGSGFGEMSPSTGLRWFVVSLTALTTGIQIAAAAFLASFVRAQD